MFVHYQKVTDTARPGQLEMSWTDIMDFIPIQLQYKHNNSLNETTCIIFNNTFYSTLCILLCISILSKIKRLNNMTMHTHVFYFEIHSTAIKIIFIDDIFYILIVVITFGVLISIKLDMWIAVRVAVCACVLTQLSCCLIGVTAKQ